MNHEYIHLKADCTIDYVYDEGQHRVPLESGSNIIPYTTLPVVVERGFTLRHLIHLVSMFPSFEAILFSNYMKLDEMSEYPIQNNDLNYISVEYIMDCGFDDQGTPVNFGQYACVEVSTGMAGENFTEFSSYYLGEVLDLPLVMTKKVETIDNLKRYSFPNMPLGLFIQSCVDAMSLCKVSVTTD